ncbi:MAG: aldehyde ferredoxin oxidoreductase family protein [Thermovirgaceae bacterium]
MFGKMLLVDLSKGTTRERNIDPGIVSRYLGGKGLGVYLLDELGKEGADPLSGDNPLLFVTGPFTGTPFPTSGRFTIVTKSPHTGIFVDSHLGGHFGHTLRKAGYDVIAVTGVASTPVYLWIEDGKAEIRDAGKMWGKTVDETVDAVRSETDPKAHVAVIGPAGENKVTIATITVDKDSDPWRAGIAGRGGSGAVMGSKNLKAVAAKGTGAIPMKDEKALKERSLNLVRNITANPQIHTRRVVGTSSLVEAMSRTGILPTKNFQQGYFSPIYGLTSTNLRYHTKRDVACFNCPIVCGKVLQDDGHDTKVEYESIALLGSNNGIGSMIDVTKAVRVCNETGMDAISAGGAVAFAMECRERGILPDAPRFGDSEGQIALLKDMAAKKNLGELLADGVRRAAEKIGKGTEDFAIAVKGLELPGYEPRAAWGMALAYATSDRGGCHQRAWTVLGELDGVLPRFKTEGMALKVKTTQDERAAAYSLVVCDFTPYDPDAVYPSLADAAAIDMDQETYMDAGERIWNHIRLFNIREAGISRKDDTLPPRMFNEPLPMPPRGEETVRLTKETFDAMLDEYYELRKWDEKGIPTPGILKELGLDN